MNIVRSMFSVFCLLAGMFISSQSVAQYGGGMGGGQYGRGMGRGMGGGMMGSQPSAASRPSIPNIAGDMAQKETKWLKDNLALDKEQYKSVKKLNNEYASMQQDAIKDIIGTGGGRPSPDAMKQVRDMMLMMNEEKEDKLHPLLTPEQWTQYQSQKEAMQKEIGGIRPPAPKTTPPASATTAGSTPPASATL